LYTAENKLVVVVVVPAVPHQLKLTTTTQTGIEADFLQAECPSCCPTNSIKALQANVPSDELQNKKKEL